MQCPKCDGPSKVNDTRKAGARIVRRRECLSKAGPCGHLFSTRELLVREEYGVIKSDGTRAEFNTASLVESLRQATAGRQTMRTLNDIANQVFRQVYRESEAAPVKTSRIGEVVMERLKELDPPSHIRFALVFDGRTDRDAEDGWDDPIDLRMWLEAEYPDLRSAHLTLELRWVLKKNGRRQEFDHAKLLRSVKIACKGRGDAKDVDAIAKRVVKDVLDEYGDQAVVTSGQLAAGVLQSLRKHSPIAYLRFVAPVKKFISALDYANEVAALQRPRSQN